MEEVPLHDEPPGELPYDQTDYPEDPDSPRPFVRADYFRRSFSLPDIANIKNSVMMHHQMDSHENGIMHNGRLPRITFNPVPATSDGTPATNGPLSYMSPKLSQSWFGGVFGCFRPIIGILSSKGFKDTKTHSWEIPYDSLRDLEYLGCGAQGSVYVGKLRVNCFYCFY